VQDFNDRTDADGFPITGFPTTFRAQANRVKYFAVITMYKEDPLEVKATLDGIYDNIKTNMTSRGEPMESACVCIVADGFKQFLESLDGLDGNGKATLAKKPDDGSPKTEFYQQFFPVGSWSIEDQRNRPMIEESPIEGIVTYQSLDRQFKPWEADRSHEPGASIEQCLADDETQLHLFEGMYCPPEYQRSADGCKSSSPDQLQVMLAIKDKNGGGKLHSHRWYFQFAERLQLNEPELFTFLFDAGTEPTDGALVDMFQALETDPDLGGVCGEIMIGDRRGIEVLEKEVKDERDGKFKPASQMQKLASSLVIDAQKFEYKASHLLDKAFESCFGYISVLPGAFSGYRLAAINGMSASGGSNGEAAAVTGGGLAITSRVKRRGQYLDSVNGAFTPLDKYFEENELKAWRRTRSWGSV
jgi:chitin synthase